MNSEVASTKSFSKYGQLVKAVLDRLVGLIALALFYPAILIVAIAIYIRMGSPIVFTQPRPGKNGEVFQFYKFRTSDERARREGQYSPRLTANHRDRSISSQNPFRRISSTRQRYRCVAFYTQNLYIVSGCI
jgi:lipopolysaccharide/colanic/teichoic acid biosynthesis glycosyltransferase